MKEIWKEVIGYEKLYQVSNLGRIRSLDMILPYKRHEKTTIRIRKGKILTPIKTKNGYLRVEMSKNGSHKLNLVHRIVASAFVPNANNFKEINHKDCNKENNRFDNLEWVSSSENKRHAYENKLYKNEKSILQIENGIIINEFKSAYEVRRKLGFKPQNIGKVALGKRKSAYGYQWKYKEKGN